MTMEIVATLGRLGEAAECRGADYLWERFGRYSIAPYMQLLDRHHGEPVAGLLSHHVTEATGMVSARFEVHEGCEAETRALAGKTKKLSIEFEGGTREFVEPVGSWAPMVMTHRGAVITGAAFTDDPARSDAWVVRLVETETDDDDDVQTRSVGSEQSIVAGMPDAVRRKYFTPRGAGLVRYGPRGRLESLRRY